MTNNQFKAGLWNSEVNVRDFIQANVTPYDGDESFLRPISDNTKAVLTKTEELLAKEQEKGGVLGVDLTKVTTVTAYGAGYVDKDHEVIVGLQTEQPLIRGINPFGGMKMVKDSLHAQGLELPEKIAEEFKFRTTHNDGVFSAYGSETRTARKLGIITGLPDAYGRGRIIGDYRRVALYGVDQLIAFKKQDKAALAMQDMNESNIRLSEELTNQIQALEDLKTMANSYGFDISKSAANAKEAIQWTYFAYLAAIKEQNGAAMSLGRVSSFFDIYLEQDIANGLLTEEEAQELIDQFVLKLRIARHLRTPEYDELFGGDPMWITECIGGVGVDGRPLVTKTSFRMLHTLYNLNAAPEPNLTILWSKDLPKNFQNYCAQVSIDTDAIQYENDDVMRPLYGDDYGIACCVSAMQIGKQMQFFGARCNLPKLLLLALNGGMEEMKRLPLGPQMPVIEGEYLDFDAVLERYRIYEAWMANLYVKTMNIIHYMHDKYAYEKVQLSLHDSKVERLMAFGIAGLSVITDSFSAIKHAKVKPIRDESGYITDFVIEGDFPKYGNDDDRVDNIAKMLSKSFYEQLKTHTTYRESIPTLSVLTITSNVVYGKKTGATPDGRAAGQAFAPGANPMHNRETNGAVAALNSVAKLEYEYCRDGISNTFSIVPTALGKEESKRKYYLTDLLNGYFGQNAHHLNVNVLNKDQLIDAFHNPTKYPNLTIRVSGYAVHFHRLSKEQQKEVIERTFHETL